MRKKTTTYEKRKTDNVYLSERLFRELKSKGFKTDLHGTNLILMKNGNVMVFDLTSESSLMKSYGLKILFRASEVYELAADLEVLFNSKYEKSV